MSQTTAAHLRQRASQLRNLSAAIEGSSVMHLDGYAGDETWRGARPQFCRQLVQRHQAHLDAEASDLLRAARLLEQQATELDRVAAQLQGRAG